MHAWLYERFGFSDKLLVGTPGQDIFHFATDRPYEAQDFGLERIVHFLQGTDKISLSRKTFGEVAVAFAEDDRLDLYPEAIPYSRATGSLFFNANGAQPGWGRGGNLLWLRAISPSPRKIFRPSLNLLNTLFTF